MSSRALCAIRSWAAALLLLLLYIEGPAAQQVLVNEIISPRTDTIAVEDMFEVLKEAPVASQLLTERRASSARGAEKDTGKRFFGRNSMSSGSEPFGSRAAFIPFWQMVQLFRSFFPSREEGALVGGGAYYLPPDMTETKKQLALSILQRAREDERLGEHLRIELRIASIPNVLLDGAPGGKEREGRRDFRVERISKNAGGQRYAVYTDGGHPEAVLSAEFRYFAAGFRATGPIEEGTELDSSMIYSSAVELGRGSSTLDAQRGNRNGRRNSRASSRDFSLAGLKAGYRYTLLEDVRPGDELDGSILDVKAPVEGGERVECLFRRGQLSLRIGGRALSSGAIGETVRVRLSSGKMSEMRVIGPGKVESEGTQG